MQQQNRRSFLPQAGTGVAGAAVLTQASRATGVRGENERVNIGLIECGGRGIQVASLMGAPHASRWARWWQLSNTPGYCSQITSESNRAANRRR